MVWDGNRFTKGKEIGGRRGRTILWPLDIGCSKGAVVELVGCAGGV